MNITRRSARLGGFAALALAGTMLLASCAANEGTGGETWRSFLTEEYANEITKAGGIGIADQVMREILSLQEQKS